MNLSKESSSNSESAASSPASKATSWDSELAKGNAVGDRRLDIELEELFTENCVAKIWKVAAELLEEEVIRCRIPLW